MKRCISIILSLTLLLTGTLVFAEEGAVESIKIGLSKTTMKVGETQKIIVSVTPSNAMAQYEYESDNPDVVTAAIGTLIANSEGTANITVRVSGTEIQDTVAVTVSNKEPGSDTGNENEDDSKDEPQGEEVIKVNKITVENKTIYLERYETERIVYSISPDDATNKDVSYRSSNS